MAARLTAYLVALIVAVTFIAGLIVGAQREDGPVDLIVVNGSVYTADNDGTMAEAIAVQGNKILVVGSNREVQRLRRPQTVVVDAKGGTVLPGFNDTHAQLIATGFATTQVNLLDASTLLSIETAILGWAAAHPDRGWVLGGGWHYDAFSGGLPHKHLLDELVPDRPAFLTAHDGRAAWANSAALGRAGITRRTPSPRDGLIVKDPRTGDPTGVLKGAAMELVAAIVPQPTRKERAAALRAAIDVAHRRGITSVHHVRATADDLGLYDELRRSKALPIRIYAALSADPDVSDAELDELDALRTDFDDDALFKTGAVAITADDDATAEGLTDLVAELDRRGWQVIIEALGDDGVRMALDALEAAIGRNEPPARGRRHRITAIEQPEPMDVARFAKLGRSAVVTAEQPQVGSPTALQEPLLGLYLGVHQTLPDGVAAGGKPAADRLTLAQAISAYTRDAAWASFEEHRKGTLERDMLADLVILSDDIFALAPSRLADADVNVTIFDGKVVYTRSAASDD